MPVLSGQKNIKTMFTLILAVLICFPLSGCQNSDLNYTVEEEKAAGAYLGNIATDSGIMNEFEPQEKALIRFVRLTLAGATQLFNVSQMTGKLYTARQLDAETLCDRSATCFQTLDVAVKKEETLMKLLSIKVFLKDINDHAPKFPSEKVHLEFLEGDTNTRRSIPNAIDKDVGTQNSQVTYQLRKKHNEPFRLTVSKKPDGSSDLNLYVDKKLDRERRQEYKVQIIAKDNGLPAKQSILDVDISVADLNDNTPTFVKSVYNVSTKNEPSDTRPIVTVLAMDPDLGENGRVTYKFSPLTSDAAKDHFKLNEDTGEIMLVKKISAGQSTVYELFVEASDGATLPLSAQVVVTVHVIPSHNNPPVIFVNFVSASPDKKTALVLEGAVTDSFIAYVKVVDHDVGHSGEVSCALVHEHFQLRSLGAEKYKVVVKKPVDRETKVKHNVTISCQDRGSPSLRSESTFAIEVVDINDNSPVFLKEDYRTSFSENNVVGMSLLQVLAKDSDVGYNGEIRFFLDATTSSWFTIGEKSGLITVTSIFDREKTPKTDFKVYARDLGKPSLTGSATVHVTINDINDEHPVFTQDSFRFKTYENQIPKFPVGYINASDPDLGAGGELTYTLKAEDKEMLPFIISDDGFLSVNKLLDYELQSAYKFKVLVEDNGSPSFNNTVDVLVEVLDENDNEPYFLFPSMNNFSMTVYYYPDSDKDITVLQAKDKDSDENALLKFEIAGGNDKGLFLVDTYSGLLSFDREATREDTGQYQLQFIVKDSGVPVQSATANLSLSLVVSNETSNLAGLQVDDDVTSHQNLLIVIALTAVTGSVGLVVVLTICLIRRNDRRDRRNAANHMGPLGTSGCHPPASKCMPSSHISTGLDLTPSLSMDNNLKGNGTFGSSQRSPYCDTNVFSPSKSSEMLQTATLSAGQDRITPDHCPPPITSFKGQGTTLDRLNNGLTSRT